jgi:branched-chain amino acid transport system permease protein
MELFKITFLRNMSGRIRLGAIIVMILVCVVLMNMAGVNAYIPVFMGVVLQNVIMAQSWTIFSGKTGYIALSSAVFFGVGQYTSAFGVATLGLPLSMLIGAALSFALAFIIGIITLRLRGIYFCIFTFALVMFLSSFMLWFETSINHTKIRNVVPYDPVTVLSYLIIVFAVVTLLIAMLDKSRFGLSLTCIGQNEDSAAHIGVNTTMVKVIAFAISAAPVGAVGAAMATRTPAVQPTIAFALLMSFTPVLMAIFGGTHSIYGPIIGAVIFTYIERTLLSQFSDIYMIVFGLIMVIAILLMPKGIVGIVESIYRYFRKGKRAVIPAKEVSA